MSTFSQINTNIQSQNAFQNLQDTSEELATRRERLSTGLRINSAEDDAAGFQIANQLEAKTGAQDQALRNIGDAKSTLSTAEGALDSQLDILQTAKEKATQAANGSLSQSERNAIGGELKELTSELDDIQSNATFNGDQLLSGDSFVFQTGADSTNTFEVETADAATDGSTLNLAGDIDLSTSSGTDEAVSVDTGDFGSGTGAGNLTASIATSGSGSVKAPSGAGSILNGGDLADGLNGGKFNIEVTDGSGSNELDFSVEGREGTQTVAVNASGTITLEGGAGAGEDSIDLEVGDNFSSGDVSANQSKEFSVTVQDQKDIGARLDGGSANNAQAIIDDVDTAIDNVSGELSDLGAAQNRLSFKESNLETSKTNLESAQSRIEDADFAKEQTQVAKLQVQQQSGTAQLAQANSAGQSVLSLLR
jgi:flagellin